MATLHHDHAGHGFVYLKGAPERALEMCTHERSEGQDRPLRRAYWRACIERMAARGQRVLACAYAPARPDQRELRFDDVTTGFTLLGLFGMADPPREEAIRAVAACHESGIRVKMITGDHAVTAAAVGAQLGIGDGHSVVVGAELARMDTAQLCTTATRVDVYARVSPRAQAASGAGTAGKRRYCGHDRRWCERCPV